MPARRISTFVGTAEERASRRVQMQSDRRQSMLQRMTPAQRVSALKQEQAFKDHQAAQQKGAADAKIRDTTGITGTKQEREAFRAEKQRVRRDDMLAAMSPGQREAALKQEAEFKASEEKKAAAQAAKQKAEQDARTRRTVGKVGSKEERQKHREDAQRVKRDDMLAKMTPEQQRAALDQEARAKEYQATKDKAAQDAKIRRTVGVVGDKARRDAFSDDKARVQRDDMLAKMTPAEREAALKQEADFKAAQDAAEQVEAAKKAARTVAIVGDKAARDTFGKPRGTPTIQHMPGLDMSNFKLFMSLSNLSQEVAA